jgi:hypothetical protein
MLIDDRSLQRALAAAGLYTGQIDGVFGPSSRAAARAFVAERAHGYSAKWPDSRARIAAEQAVLKAHGFYESEVDGLAGPATHLALERWQDFITFKRPSPAPAAGVKSATAWPRQKDMIEFYGVPGKCPLVKLVSPYPLYLDWDLSDSLDGFMIHQRCHDSALRAMKRVLAYYGLDQIHALGLDQFGGCLNVRRMRNGSAWSTHAFAAAIDWDADRNQLRETSRTARMARPEYAPFLDAWEAEGWLSLGRARNFDWMHLQAARL